MGNPHETNYRDFNCSITKVITINDCLTMNITKICFEKKNMAETLDIVCKQNIDYHYIVN